MRVELHDGNHAELRDRLSAGDRRAAKAAIKFTIADDGSRVISAELEDQINYALLTAMIVSWTIGQPLPRDAVDPVQVLDLLDIEDIEALAAAVRPHYDRILNGPKATIVSGSVLPTGSSAG